MVKHETSEENNEFQQQLVSKLLRMEVEAEKAGREGIWKRPSYYERVADTYQYLKKIIERLLRFLRYSFTVYLAYSI